MSSEQRKEILFQSIVQECSLRNLESEQYIIILVA